MLVRETIGCKRSPGTQGHNLHHLLLCRGVSTDAARIHRMHMAEMNSWQGILTLFRAFLPLGQPYLGMFGHVLPTSHRNNVTGVVVATWCDHA